MNGKSLMRIQQREVEKLKMKLTATFDQNDQELSVSNLDYFSYPVQFKDPEIPLISNQLSSVQSEEPIIMNDMKLTPKSTFPDSFAHIPMQEPSLLDGLIRQVPILSSLYQNTVCLLLCVVALIVMGIGFILKKYQTVIRELQQANMQLAQKNQELEFQRNQSMHTNSLDYDYDQDQPLCITYEQLQSQHSQSSSIHIESAGQLSPSEESQSQSSTDTAQEHQINDSSSINFSPDSKRQRLGSFKQDGLTPQLHYGNQNKNQMKRIQFNTSSPYTSNLVSSPMVKTLSFDLNCRNQQSQQQQHELHHFGQPPETLSVNRKTSSSHILIEDQGGDLRKTRDNSNMRCKRNLFQKPIQNIGCSTQKFNSKPLNKVQDLSSSFKNKNAYQDVTFDRISEIENDPYGMMSQAHLQPRPLYSDRSHMQKQRQASLQKKETVSAHFRVPQPQRKFTAFQRNQCSSLGRQAFNTKSMCSPTLQGQAMGPQQHFFNLSKQGHAQLPQNPNYSPYIQSQPYYPTNLSQDQSPKISMLPSNQRYVANQKNSSTNVNKCQSQMMPYFDLAQIDQESKYLEFESARSQEQDDEFFDFPLEDEQISEESEQERDDYNLLELEQSPECDSNELVEEPYAYNDFHATGYEHDLRSYVMIVPVLALSKSPAIHPSRDQFEQLPLLKKPSNSPPPTRLSLREDLTEEINEKDFPCLLYLETGRYKNSFEEICFLGKGGFGVAHKVRHKLDSNFYAIKKIRIHLGQNQDIKEHRVYREIMALPQLNHKNVVRYFGCWAERIRPEEELKIQDRIKKIKASINQAKKTIKGKIVEKKREHKVSKFDLSDDESQVKQKKTRKGKVLQKEEEEIVPLNEFDEEAELENAFENRSTFSQSEDNSVNSEQDPSEHSESSYESQSESESDSEDEEEDEDELENSDLISPSFYHDDDEEDDENSKMEKFDDEALIEFIKKEQKFISLDLMIQMEFCSGSTLQDHLEEPSRNINRQENFSYFKQLLQAVKHIHSNGFIHRDLKPPNIFIEGNAVRVGDFGLARRVNNHMPNIQKIQQALSSSQISPKAFRKMSSIGIKKIVKHFNQQSLLTTQVGTSTYLSPEQETNKIYNEKVDIFALGLILCEMYSKFSTLHERITTLNDLKYSGKLPAMMLEKYPVECEIIKMMTNKDPTLRPSAQDLLKHPLLEKWSKLVAQTLISPREPQATSNPQDQTVSNEVVTNDHKLQLFSKEPEAQPQLTSNNSIETTATSTQYQQDYSLSLLQHCQSQQPLRDEIAAELEQNTAPRIQQVSKSAQSPASHSLLI